MTTALRTTDGFLPREHWEGVQSLLLGNEFPWYLNSSTVDEEDGDPSNYQFVHGFYNNGMPNSGWMEMLTPLIAALDPLALIRVKANLNPRTGRTFQFPLHVDVPSEAVTTAVYYVNTNDGKTVFSSGEFVESVANRLVRFNAMVPHSGTTCTDQKVRCVININYVEK